MAMTPVDNWKDAVGRKPSKCVFWTSQGVQWLRLHTSNADGVSSIPGQETKILHDMQRGQR